MSGVQNITVPYVPLSEFDWSLGRTGPLPWNQTLWSFVAVFTALPIWMNIELLVLLFYIFRRYSGLYFWSVLITSWSIMFHALGFILEKCVPECPWFVATMIAEIGWVGMVTGFSTVLYSRLHLIACVTRNPHILRLALAMIITDAFIFHVPIIVFQFGLADPKTHDQYLVYLRPMERVQVLGFSLQEMILTAIYIYGTLEMVRDSFNPKTRLTTRLLVLIQIAVILCDFTVISLDYKDYYMLKAFLQSFFYSLKLQLEFVILNQFRDVISKGVPTELGIIPDDNMAFKHSQNNRLTTPETSRTSSNP